MAVKKKRPLAFVPGERTSVAPPKARPTKKPAPAESALPLGSGRTLHVRSVDTGETVEVRSAKGDVEVSITLGEGGPVVRVHGAQALELASPRVAVKCDTFELDARERANLTTQGEIKLKAVGDVVVNGAFVKLNCDENSPHPPVPPSAIPPRG